MIYYFLVVVCIGLIIFSGYKHYKHTHTKQLSRPHRRQSSSR